MINRLFIKSILLLMIALGIVFGFSFSALSEEDKPQILSLTLVEALDLGIENNANIDIAHLLVEAKLIDFNQAKYKAKELQKDINESESHIPINQDVYLVLNVNPALKDNEYNLALATEIYTVKQTKHDIETAYYSLSVAQESLNAAKLSLNRNETLLNNVKAKEVEGLASKVDIYNAQTYYLSSQAAYVKAQDNLNYIQMLFNQMLGLNIDTVIELEDKLVLEEKMEINIEETYLQAQKTDLTYLAAKSNYDIITIMSDYTQKYSSANTFDYKNAEVNRKQSEVAFNDSKTNLEIRLRYAYSKLNTAMTNYKSLLQGKYLAEEGYRLADLRYQSGIATIYDVENAEATLKETDAKLLEAIKEYNLSIAAFRYGIFPEPGTEMY